MPRTALCLTQTWLLALESCMSAARVQPRAPGPSNSDLWESPWLTHDSHKGPTEQGFPELQALSQSPTELLRAAPTHYLVSKPLSWQSEFSSQDSAQLAADLTRLISEARLLLLLNYPVQVLGLKDNMTF